MEIPFSLVDVELMHAYAQVLMEDRPAHFMEYLSRASGPTRPPAVRATWPFTRLLRVGVDSTNAVEMDSVRQMYRETRPPAPPGA